MAVHRQSYANSCGASCLLCAALELGVVQVPHNAVYPHWAVGPNPLVNSVFCETQLYEVTGENGRAGGPPANWGYSLPSGVVECARLLGLHAWAVAHRTWSVRGLKMGYRQELNRLVRMGALAQVGGSWWRRNRSVTAPVAHQRELKILVGRDRANFGGLHYVMVRPNGTVMEPGAGADQATIAHAKAATNMHGTGLSVYVQVQE
jgi:hypothetical protein